MGNGPESVGPWTTSRRPDEFGTSHPTKRLRVVMVVANDVTRDSRVLREAAVLAAAGHGVTVLGIMTGKTVAPEVEVRDGFVIRRLRYRAKPPGWWIPPNFYGRVRYRANRQYRIHRARIVAMYRRARRHLKLANARRRRARILAGGRTAQWRAGIAATRARQLAATHRIGAHARERLDRLRLLAGRARRTTPNAWSRHVRGGIAAAVGAMTGEFVWLRPFAQRHARPAGGMPGFGSGITGNHPGRGIWSRAGSLAALWIDRLVAPSLGVARVIASVLRAWGSIAALLGWGTLYLGANWLTRGAIEWQTGWRWRWLGWARFVAEHAPDADVWHAHDMTSLPAVVELKRRRGGFAIYDSHEVYFESGRHAEQPRWAKAPMEALERELTAEVDAVVSVNDSVARILERRLACGVVHVLYNCPPRAVAPMRGSPLRHLLALPRTTPLLLYHGSLAPHRGIEQLLLMIQRPEMRDAHLAFLGFGPMTEWLRDEVGHQRYGGRAHLVDAVEPSELPRWLQGVDVAVAPIQPSTLNHRNSSPNKVFEAIAAGTPVAGSDFPEFRRVIADPLLGPLGTLFDPADPRDIARAVRAILDAPPVERAALRRRCRAASARRWNWETESLRLIALYDRMSLERARPSSSGTVGAHAA